MPGTNVSGIREGEENLYLESKRRMKHPVQHHTMCPLVRQDRECCTPAAYLANTPAETCRGKLSPKLPVI